MKVLRCLFVVAILLCASVAHAHVGSPDVYADGEAGPYHLSIVIRPPLVIPGVADIEVRSLTSGVQHITITPVPLTGEASKHPPVPDAMQQPSPDNQYYSGHLWIMAPGSWQIRFAVSGTQGNAELSIPLPAAALATRTMQRGLGSMLLGLGGLLLVGMIGIVGAAAREAKLPPGAPVPKPNFRYARIAMGVSAALLVVLVILGNRWWNSEASSYAGNVYKPLRMTPTVEANNLLKLKLSDPGWLSQRKLDDFIPDHDHLMHLYMVRWPQMDAVYHLHPDPAGTGEFDLQLPTMPAGTYHLYADVVHAAGFPETPVCQLTVPAITGRALAGDDAAGTAPALGSPEDHPEQRRFVLPDGYTMVWNNAGPLHPRSAISFEFTLLDRTGHPAKDEALYMGMLGHAAFVKTDGSVFAHIHPNGTMAMAAFMMANKDTPNKGSSQPMEMADMPGMDMSGMGKDSLPANVTFPYGFPSGGRYRIFVQMKHSATVETGVFDADVPNS